MPTIRRFASCKIAIYPDDHMPPHFHIEGRGFRAIIEIETMRIRTGRTRDALDAIIWARQDTALLRREWLRLNRWA
jgi:hypothetical protein